MNIDMFSDRKIYLIFSKNVSCGKYYFKKT